MNLELQARIYDLIDAAIYPACAGLAFLCISIHWYAIALFFVAIMVGTMLAQLLWCVVLIWKIVRLVIEMSRREGRPL